jgi:YVTN family beta-propeller protein
MIIAMHYIRGGLVSALIGCFVFAQSPGVPARSVTDPGVVTTRQAITPAGVQSVFQGRLYGAAWAGDGDELWLLHTRHVYRLDWRNNKIKAELPHGGVPGNQSIAAWEGGVIAGNSMPEGRRSDARLLSAAGDTLKVVAEGLGAFLPGALSVARNNKLAVVPLVYENKVAVVDLTSGAAPRAIETNGIAPFASVVNAEGTVAYVSNLGGRPPKPGETVASPMQKREEKIVVDARGIASTGAVVRVDLQAGKVTHSIATGLHPTALAWNEKAQRLYVANGNSESVSVIDTESNRVLRSIEIQPFSEKVRGIAPTAVALTPDGKTLLVACGGINAIAVIDTGSGSVRGLIPTSWYPSALAVSPDGARVAVTALLGAGSGWRDVPAKRFVHSQRSSVSVIDLPDAAQLASYTTAVAENNHLRATGEPARAPVQRAVPAARQLPVPARSGDLSPIEHVVYIIKENRTYDQVLGDMPKGNGDPSLVMFGADVTPNQHAFADRYVLLDNFYATGGNSGDGHQWATQANETEYCLWPGYQGRSYPFDGTDPMAYSAGGFLWDYALARGRTVRVYGEYAGRLSISPAQRAALLKRWRDKEDFTKEWSIRADIEGLNKILAANYPPYTTAIPDVVRAQIFLADLQRMEQSGKLPNLMLIQLPSNHTDGTAPGRSSPKAMAADNDFALGQIVEGLTHTKFWPKMAIFVVEDDAQNGVDHVDGHRTTAFVISPYAKRNHVDSTFYSHQSMLKTIELVLGLPTMSLFDLIANDMRNSFTETPDVTPWSAIAPKQSLQETNPAARALKGKAREAAIASARMNWSVPDAAPTEKLNRILWGAIKGWDTEYPGPRRAVFSPLSVETDDDDR